MQMSALDLIASIASLMMSLCPLRSSTAATILALRSSTSLGGVVKNLPLIETCSFSLILLDILPDCLLSRYISIWEAYSKLISNLLKAPTSEPLTYYEYSLILGQLHELAMLNACS
ncbi:unnamed protein product [Owenia fusiformis]|uniref:Uncharacterized protein n=1 Tax=Owenia fusiformis TaxID=6347 RepID=A0A8J1YAP0_OWEFU|nr:unnamed protein product [Owenia fusiformis]